MITRLQIFMLHNIQTVAANQRDTSCYHESLQIVGQSDNRSGRSVHELAELYSSEITSVLDP